ncbi:MAG: hypothetical protein EA343_14055 [Nodularia sp. (in: Bacteria)]|nr:MAG: hypothetical protein EA343_14055 [Nodularia sp. (in: cyanobacteria)]
MKLLYIGDNRNRSNWGCRATSIALRRLLDRIAPVSGVIYGKEVAAYSCTPTPINSLIPLKLFMFSYRNRNTRFFRDYVEFEKNFHLKMDYVTENVNESVRNFLKYKNFYPHLSEIYEFIESCDALVFNGEGDIIFTTPPRRNHIFYLMIIEIAHQLGKKIFYVNSMISPCPSTGINKKNYDQTITTLSKCSFVSVRDLESLSLLNKFNLNTKYGYIPDALFTWFHYFDESSKLNLKNGDFLIPFPEKESYFGKLNLSKPYICVGGSSLAAWDKEKAIPRYIELVNTLKNIGINTVLVQSCDGDVFLQKVALSTNVPIVPVETPILLAATVLANAQVFISGRYHPSIMASLGGTPCIFLGSNSHKTRSLQDVLEYENVVEFSAYPSLQECQEILKMAQEMLEEGEERRNKILTVVKKLALEAESVATFIK